MQTYSHQIEVTFDWQKLPAVTLPLVLSVVSPESIGNLLKNGDFEQVEEGGKKPKYWDGINAQLAPSDGLGLGLGKHVLKFANSKGYSYYGQSREPPRRRHLPLYRLGLEPRHGRRLEYQLHDEGRRN